MLLFTFTILLITSTNGEFFIRKPKQEIREDLIIHKTRTLLTSCHMQCDMMSECAAYGTETNDAVGGMFDCFLIGYDTRKYYEEKNGEKTIGLFVVEMVIIYLFTYSLTNVQKFSRNIVIRQGTFIRMSDFK